MATHSNTPKKDAASAAKGGAAGDAAEKGFPGYPYYPSEEDIMNPQNGFEKSKTDTERLSNAKRSAEPGNNSTPTEEEGEDLENEDLEMIEDAEAGIRSEADLTPDDLIALGEKDSDQDMGEDEILGKQSKPDQHEGLQEEGLDVPGSELDDDNEDIGEEDEENNYYSLGGDRHEDQENDPA